MVEFVESRARRVRETMPAEVTHYLRELRRGDGDAAARLLPLVYRELRQLAAVQLGRSPSQTLQPTMLVHDAYLKLAGSSEARWESRRHFFAVAAIAMRELIVDAARRRMAAKRGGGHLGENVATLSDVPHAAVDLDEALSVDRALKRLEEKHPRQAQVVALRYFAGLSEEEIAEALEVTPRTVERDWRFARAWLHDALGEESPHP